MHLFKRCVLTCSTQSTSAAPLVPFAAELGGGITRLKHHLDQSISSIRARFGADPLGSCWLPGADATEDEEDEEEGAVSASDAETRRSMSRIRAGAAGFLVAVAEDDDEEEVGEDDTPPSPPPSRATPPGPTTTMSPSSSS